MKQLNRERLNEALRDPKLPSQDRRALEDVLAVYDSTLERNPLVFWTPHSEPQREFMAATTRVQAAFAGNRFGKTTALVVKALIQLVPEELVPEHLMPYRMRFKRSPPPCMGRIVVPDLVASLTQVLIPAFRQWTPKDAYASAKGFEGSYDKQNRVLKLKGGSQIQFMTYEMDLDKFGGAALHFVGYDEPPPEDIRRECQMRTVDYAGFEMFAMTPLMGIGWVYREIYKRREAPHVTVIRGTIHDNPMLDEDTKLAVLSEYDESDPERRAREFGEFAHFGGLIYPGGFDAHLIDEPSPEQLKGKDIVVGMDPGLKNAAFVWLAFDEDNRAHVFDVVLLKEKTPKDYARAIRATNARWQIKDPLYVIDPSARNRSLVNAESIEAELSREGIYAMHGQNDVQAGVQQVRTRLANGMLKVSRECRGLRSEAEEYRMQDNPDGEFKVVKERDHRLDALRYACMARAWNPGMDLPKPDEQLGWVAGEAMSERQMHQLFRKYHQPVSPTGFMS